MIVILSAALSAPLFSYASMNVAGQTGLIATPSARVAWEETGENLHVTTGYHYFNNNYEYHAPQATVGLFGRFEIGGTYNVAPGTNNNDFLLHSKLRFSPWSGRGNSALAIGGSYQSLNSSPTYTVGQLYLAATYSAQFFGMDADTSIVIGKTFGDISRNGDVDFSMGFDLVLLPSVFNGYLRWVNELSNYDFLYRNAPTSAASRGAFNTGLRVPVLKHMSAVRFDITVAMTDALDSERGFSAGAVFGAKF